jgi:DnaK suppressor protein
VKKSSAEEPPAKKVTAAQKTVQKAAQKAVKKTVAKAPAKKAPAPKAAVKKAPAKKPAKKPATKAATKTSTTKTSTTKKSAAKKTAPTTSPTTSAAPAPTKKAAVKNTAKKTATAGDPTGIAEAQELVVLAQEDPWTKAELKTVRTQLVDDVKRLAGELAEVEGDLAGMIENSGEGAGNDQADVGSASFERDQEMVIVNNARDMLEQSQHALERIADGSYGQCEICGNAIGKNRLMAFPRATLCLSCKQREERR